MKEQTINNVEKIKQGSFIFWQDKPILYSNEELNMLAITVEKNFDKKTQESFKMNFLSDYLQGTGCKSAAEKLQKLEFFANHLLDNYGNQIKKLNNQDRNILACLTLTFLGVVRKIEHPNQELINTCKTSVFYGDEVLHENIKKYVSPKSNLQNDIQTSVGKLQQKLPQNDSIAVCKNNR